MSTEEYNSILGKWIRSTPLPLYGFKYRINKIKNKVHAAILRTLGGLPPSAWELGHDNMAYFMHQFERQYQKRGFYESFALAWRDTAKLYLTGDDPNVDTPPTWFQELKHRIKMLFYRPDLRK